MQDTLHNFIQTTANVFKRHYGAYPERIGLDYFTRMREWGARHYYSFYSMAENSIPGPPTKWTLNIPAIPYNPVQIKIDPAVFEQIRYTPLTHQIIQPKTGYDEVICEGSNVKVFMTLWFTEKGYHAIVWDSE